MRREDARRKRQKEERRKEEEERKRVVEEKERWREEEERKQNEEKVDTVISILFGAMVLERIPGSYMGCYQDEVWDVWDYPDCEHYLEEETMSSCDSIEYLIDLMTVCFCRYILN